MAPLRKILSRDCGPFWQFAKYAAVGATATCVNIVAFYALAATWLKCLSPDDGAVRILGLPAVDLPQGIRAFRAAIANAAGFAVANVFCWMLDRIFVFTPGRHRWYRELALFFGFSAIAAGIATCVQSALIGFGGVSTSVAFCAQIFVALALNFAARKFLVFKR